MLTEPKTALAGVKGETSLARSKPWIVMFRKERISPLCLFRQDSLGGMVEGREDGVVRRLCGKSRTQIRMGGKFLVTRLVETEPFDGECRTYLWSKDFEC